MSFNSIAFAFLLVAALAIRFAPINWTVRKTGLLALSYAFYASWYPVHLAILLGLTVVIWLFGGAIERAPSGGRRKLLAILSVAFTLLPLLVFKYFDFALETLNSGIALLHRPPIQSSVHLLLPIGISFYTFEAIAYTVDIYTGRIKSRGSLLDFGLFLAFFPRMVSGPIMRAAEFLPQCEQPARITSEDLAEGFGAMIVGLFQKVVLADAIFAPVVDRVYAVGAANNALCAWTGTIAFAFQIYFDFAGYSIAAIGIAKMLGFDLPANFKAPYSAHNLSEFWRRWHISLSTWLRDYLYIPLGGNRKGEVRTKINLMLTMALGGLWHGAGLRFIAWGALHGFYLVCQQRGRSRKERETSQGGMPSVIFTFILVCITWVFFRATSLGHSLTICRQLVGAGSHALYTVDPTSIALTLAVATGALLFQWKNADTSFQTFLGKLSPGVRVLVFTGLILGMLFAPQDDHAFIYFQF